MRDKLTDILRIGIVSSIDAAKGTAEVTFEDRGDVVSRNLFIVNPFTLKDKAYYMPAIGERVVTLFFPEAPSRGCILGSYYADNRLPPFGDENKTYLYFEDKGLIEYDKKLHTLTINIPESGDKSLSISVESDVSLLSNGRINIEAAKEINISCESDITILSDSNINIKSESNITINSLEGMTIKSESNISVESSGDISVKSSGRAIVESQDRLTLRGSSVVIEETDKQEASL